MKKAIYAGSFDPFTEGHFEILKESCKIFDEVYIVLATNSNKYRRTDIGLMQEGIENTLKNRHIYNCKVIISENQLIAKLAQLLDITYLVRGLRNINDYLYEDNLATINLEINPKLNIIYLRSHKSIISSSLVWELYAHDEPIDKYIPKEILKTLKKDKNKETL